MLNVQHKKLKSIEILYLQGQIVRGEEALLDGVVRPQSDVSTVVLDLTGVSTIDASGLGTLLRLREQVQSSGADLKLMNVSRLVSRVLEISRLDSVFEVTSGAEFMCAASLEPNSSAPQPGCAW